VGVLGVSMMLLMGTSSLFAASANAAAPVTVRGEISCINSASPVGVWVVGEQSRSGWAKIAVPIKLGGHSMVTYEYVLDKGGRYRVNVGCGGTPQSWGKSLSSGYMDGTVNNLKCNDLLPFLKWIGKRVIRVDLSQGVKYLTCAKV
jgi:hypothetical protein